MQEWTTTEETVYDRLRAAGWPFLDVLLLFSFLLRTGLGSPGFLLSLPCPAHRAACVFSLRAEVTKGKSGHLVQVSVFSCVQTQKLQATWGP